MSTIAASDRSVASLGNGVTQPIDRGDVSGLLESLRCADLPDPEGEFFVDWMGVRTRIPMLPWAPAELAGTVSEELPIPDDGYRSEDIEYAALARALRDTESHPLRIVEIGAGWAPWAVAGLVHARRRGQPGIAVAVEADPRRCAWAMQHARDNQVEAVHVSGRPRKLARLISDALSTFRGHAAQATQLLVVVQAAGWHETTTVAFPDADIEDMGTAVWTLPGTDVDYRGAHLRHGDVPAISIPDLLAAIRETGTDRTVVDLLHVDVQGVEFELLERAADGIQTHTRLMGVGTHSRWNEGQLQHFFLERGWGLLIDEPCKAHFTMTHPTLSGFTVQDGMQLWENPFVL